MDGWTDGWMDGLTLGQTDGRTDRQTDRETDRQKSYPPEPIRSARRYKNKVVREQPMVELVSS
jgi:hypothetical protein